jgi:MFS family permease
MASTREKLDEWRRLWTLPLTALVGISGSGAIVYSTGVFMDEVVADFGWSKTQYTSAMTGQILVLLFAVPLVGRAIDRFGPRRVALSGILPAIAGAAGLGLANGEVWQWWLLNLFHTVGSVMIVPPVWITAVSGRFDASRGLALAVALAGTGVGTALWPILAANYIELFGWRWAYLALGLTWGAVIVPLALLFFFGPSERATNRNTGRKAAPPITHQLVSPKFVWLTLAAAVFVVTSYALVVHLVPILREAGLDLRTAASLAGLTGICSIIGRILTGLLLDSVPTKAFAVVVFALPAIVSLLLGLGDSSMPIIVCAVVVMGLAMGAESDILAYIASRQFDHSIFGSVFAAIQTVTAVASLCGVMLAGYLFDLRNDYSLFLALAAPAAVFSALCIFFVPARVSAPERDAPASSSSANPAREHA